MAEVYAAVDLRVAIGAPDRNVALKLITLDGARARSMTPAFKRLIERFQREIEILRRIKHPGVPRLIASGYDEERSQPYLAMELLHGCTLAEVIAEGAGALPVRAIAGIAGQVAEVLALSHAADILHRDLKPSNVMLEDDGRAMVLDFGVGLLIGPDAPERLTSTGAAVGTYQYMSPEQVTGGELTVASDLYNLGCLLYELVAGTPPFPEGTDQQILMAHLQREPTRLELMRSDLPDALTTLVTGLLAKDPENRPPDARFVAERLRAIASAAPSERLSSRICRGDPAAVLGPLEPRDRTPAPATRPPLHTASEEAEHLMNVFEVHRKLIDEYQRFTSGGVVIADPRIKNFVEDDMRSGTQWPDPFVALNPFFEPGGRVDKLAASGLLHPECANIFQTDKTENGVVCNGRPIILHKHQRDAIEAAQRGESYVLTTGTGSGKSLSYIVPVVDKVLRERDASPARRGIRAIVVYPMNALANSQKQELEKFLSRGYPEGDEPVAFARYTGQEPESEREKIRKNPPDILLTNYVMLELLLTRPEERQKLIGAARGLQFLVFDELHTYRGRQGADIAWLIRRVRDACNAPDVQCIGTSATMATEGSPAEQREEVAKVAAELFGLADRPRVIGETLVRACSGDAAAVTAERIAAPAAPARYSDLAADPLASWIEQRFGLRADDTGTLVRQDPTTIEDAAEALSEETGAGRDACESALRKTLLAGSAAKHPETTRPLFAFRLHQFLSKGDHVYTTAEPEQIRKFTRDYQVMVPGTADALGRGKRLYPLAFCRDCGQEYLTVLRTTDIHTGRFEYRARIDNDLVEDDHVQTGYLCIDTDRPWTADIAALIEADRLPESWLETDGAGNRTLAKNKVGHVPRAVQVDPTGYEGDGIGAAFISGRFNFCLACGITHEGARGKDFGRLAAFNQEGRSSATSVVSANILDSLRSSHLRDKAKKLLAFVDNRQDAALQAGHLNDFARVVQLRGALYRALKKADGGLDDEDVAAAVVAEMGLGPAEYASSEALPGSQMARRARSTFEAIVNLHLHVDLRRGWRVTMPNLEQTGQLVLDYHDLDLIAGSDWSGCHHALADADPQARRDLLKALLDAMRRSLAIEAECLDAEGFDSLQRGSQSRLSEAWRLDETEDKPEQATVYPMPEPKGSDKTCAFMSGRSKMGRHVASVLRGTGSRLSTDERQEIIHDMLRTLARYGLVTEVPPPPSRRGGPFRGPRRPDATGYRVNAGAFLWKAGRGREGIDDPLAVTRKQGRPPVHTYFRDLYDSPEAALVNLRAKEHTAQVSPTERQLREDDFREARLPLLYCSPTMELGVDIAELNAVMMRNVPPTPANYAQRSGRAGRSGQQALVVTYCATGNSHDQYYFDRREQMTAGAVTPPRIDLCNEDLIAAHLHAIWLSQLDGFRLGRSVTELVQTDALEVDDPDVKAELPLHDHVTDAIRSTAARARTLEIARALLADLEPALAETTWWDQEWLERTVKRIPQSFDEAFGRWRTLYRAAKVEREEQHRRQDDTSLTPRDRKQAGRRRREAETQLALLRNESDDDFNLGADFYPHRYLASEGFLPGYSFPRLPLAAYIPNRAGTGAEGDYLQRARFLAIREFGPDALIYHEGRRYQVKRIQLPPSESGDLALTRAKRCPVCGCGHDERDKTDICNMCKTRLPNEGRQNLLELRTVFTTPRERISSDEEERRRAGYILETSYRFNDKGQQGGRSDAIVRDRDGELARIAYGDAATVRMANIRRRIAGRDEPDGYFIDPSTGQWISKKQAADAVGDASELADDDTETRLRARVVPYVEDTRNIAILSLDHAIDPDQALSLMYALERGIEAVFQLEDSELTSDLPTGADDQTRFLLFVESAEGGAGVLRRLHQDPGALAKAARRALEICHFDPDTGEDLWSEDCAKGCYKCLLSYGNQIVHDRISRHGAKDLLLKLSRAEALTTAAGKSRTDEHRRLEQGADSSLERDFLAMVKAEGYRLPSQTQVLLEDHHARPDFVYYVEGGTYAVFVDGPVHDRKDVFLRDGKAEARLIDAGWMVIRFRYDDDWHDVIARHREVFGPGKAKTADDTEDSA
ncbi:DEAD/DEAH box helicase [Glycomyces sp. NPDC047369]